MGAQLVLESAVKTGNTAGDGTTTATVLAHVIYREGTKLVAAGYHPLALKRGIDIGVERVVGALAKMSRLLKGKRDIARVAAISANGDTAIGKLIGEAVGKVGLEGIIHVEQGAELETKLEVAEGAEIDRGYSSAYFVNDMERLVARLDDAYILICPNKISAVSELLPILEKVAKTKRALLVVAEVTGEALSLLVVNKLQGTMNVCAVMAPYYGESRMTSLRDLAAQTGGRIVGEEAGIKLGEATLEDLGRAKKIVVDQEKTTIVGAATNKAELEARVQRDPRALRGHELDVQARAARGAAAPSGRRRGADSRRRHHRSGGARTQAARRGRAVRRPGRDRGRDRARRRHRAAARGRRAREAAEGHPGGAAGGPRDRPAGVRGAVPPDRRQRRPGRVGGPRARPAAERRARVQRRPRRVRESLRRRASWIRRWSSGSRCSTRRRSRACCSRARR